MAALYCDSRGCGNGCTVIEDVFGRTVRRVDNSDGEIVTTTYPVFPGIDIVYTDAHASGCTLCSPADEGKAEIRHCREGRFEYERGDDCFFLAQGDLSVSVLDGAPCRLSFPTGHYHGVSVVIDPGTTPRCLSCFLEDVEVRPAALIDKFCADKKPFIARSSVSVAHIFSELYSVPEGIRKGYFKVKILELLLFLSALDTDSKARSFTRSQVRLAEQVGAFIAANPAKRLTTDELARRFGASKAQLGSSFRGVYGMSPAAFMRAQKMRSAAELLRSTDRTVLDVAGQFGYDNASKFAKAFRDVIGVSPAAYRNGDDRDSCAPQL